VKGGGPTHRRNAASIKKDGSMIDYPDKNSAIRPILEMELRKNSVEMRMPSKGRGGPE